jgi:hypothetical protein
MTRKIKTEPYRPSNGTEGDMFMANWCERCTKDRARRRSVDHAGCRILSYMMAFHIEDPEFPKQIVRTADVPYIESDPRCTAFRASGAPRNMAKQRAADSLPLFSARRVGNG